jgi:hypothetical protein
LSITAIIAIILAGIYVNHTSEASLSSAESMIVT